ncbi:MBL fold metallo-hydrolase [Solimonas terrae]|uniref:MBL fold metallo-hydrolase n=1 Tax=Solimonas terrae TaxID=1396819 RepID=A0A6M2BTN4_9GAMM|nr:MBL fold metallo-hydrolase [Solimonas terrae]NGY05744.1 MBL fold metallo-hydrolase [Solimonas terrae]
MHRSHLSLALAAAVLALCGATTVAAGPTAIRTQAPSMAAAGFYRLPLGKFTVTALADGSFDMPAPKLLIEDQPGIVKQLLGAAGYGDTVPTSINGFLIDTGSKRVLIDTGSGGAMGPTTGKLLEHLRAAGYDPAQIDEILITHLHPDHFGGLTHDGRMVFPNAVLRMSAAELKFWVDDAKTASADARAALAPYRAAGHLQPFAAGATLDPGITAVDTRGHTAGHSSYRIESEGKTLLVWGDLLHVAAVQFADPKVTIQYDTTPTAAEAQREKVLADAARSGEWIAAAHIAFPGIGHVVKAGDEYAWQPIETKP